MGLDIVYVPLFCATHLHRPLRRPLRRAAQLRRPLRRPSAPILCAGAPFSAAHLCCEEVLRAQTLDGLLLSPGILTSVPAQAMHSALLPLTTPTPPPFEQLQAHEILLMA